VASWHRGLCVKTAPMWGAAALSLALVAGGCGTALSTWKPSPNRAADLPDGADALMALADVQFAIVPRTGDTLDRSLAALEAIEPSDAESDYETHWRWARACFYLTEYVGNEVAHQRYVLPGISHAMKAIEASQERVEGHYFLALNLARGVEATSDIDGLAPMMEVAQRAAEIDPSYDEAGPLRLLGKVYMVAPVWPTSVGDRDEAVEVLKRAVSLAGTPLNRLFLGQAFFHVEDFEHAVPHVRRAIKLGSNGGLEARWLEEARSYLMRMGAAE
jgi:tetratricopeptide (TPR) repeat protein